jgi:hypothetical protein
MPYSTEGNTITVNGTRASFRTCPVDTGAVHGPTAIPYRNMSGRDEGHPHNPGLYGRYLALDLTANNRHSIDAWCKRFPDRPRPDLGCGVCRHGFGLQDFRDGRMSQEVAEARAIALNHGRPATDVPNA